MLASRPDFFYSEGEIGGAYKGEPPMGVLRRVILALVLTGALVVPAQALPPAEHVVISEIQTASADDAAQEFVELYNATQETVDLTGWVIEYKSASSADAPDAWITRAELEGQLPAYHYYLISTYLTHDSDLSSGLAQSGGHIRVLDADGSLVDLVGWGSANSAETEPAPAAQPGESLERLPGEFEPDGGNAYDTQNNRQDFRVRPSPEPQSAANAETPLDDFEAPAEAVVSYSGLVVSELFVDPVSPQADAEDEFVELHNSSSQPIELSGVRVETGSTFNYDYVLPPAVIPPGGYLALMAIDSGLTLSNSGGQARVLDPDGAELYRTAAYPAAEPAHSWAEVGGSWQWTAKPTPGAVNVLEVAPAAAGKQKAAKAKKAAAKRKAAARRLGSSRVASAAAKKNPAAAVLEQAKASQWLLLGLGGLTIAYAAYEFRYDLQNFYRLARRKLRFRA